MKWLDGSMIVVRNICLMVISACVIGFFIFAIKFGQIASIKHEALIKFDAHERERTQ